MDISLSAGKRKRTMKNLYEYDMVALGIAIKKARFFKEKKTQHEIGEETGIRQASISQAEDGKLTIDSDTIGKLLVLFNIDKEKFRIKRKSISARPSEEKE